MVCLEFLPHFWVVQGHGRWTARTAWMLRRPQSLFLLQEHGSFKPSRVVDHLACWQSSARVVCRDDREPSWMIAKRFTTNVWNRVDLFLIYCRTGIESVQKTDSSSCRSISRRNIWLICTATTAAQSSSLGIVIGLIIDPDRVLHFQPFFSPTLSSRNQKPRPAFNWWSWVRNQNCLRTMENGCGGYIKTFKFEHAALVLDFKG